MSPPKWRCTECGWVGSLAEILCAPNPFDPENGNDRVSGCPECKAVNEFEALCDVEGCLELGGCGWPSRDGYRHTCHKHYEAEKECRR